MKQMLTNRLLTRVPDAELARLTSFLEPVSLSAGERLTPSGEAARFVYFPESAVISCYTDMQDGRSAEVAMIGREGMAGLSSLFGSHARAQSLAVAATGMAFRVKKADFERELDSAGSLRHLLLDYAGEYMAQISRRAACNILHLTEQRLAVWLLMLTERLGTDTVVVTQEKVAQHLGVRRAGISVIAGELQERGVISYTRGQIRVANRRTLEATACECYAAMNAQGGDPIAA